MASQPPHHLLKLLQRHARSLGGSPVDYDEEHRPISADTHSGAVVPVVDKIQVLTQGQSLAVKEKQRSGGHQIGIRKTLLPLRHRVGFQDEYTVVHHRERTKLVII